MGNIVFGSRVNVVTPNGETHTGIFCNYSGKGIGAWVDFPDNPELSDFYPMSRIKAHVAEEPVMMLTNCPGCGDEMQVAMVDGIIPGKACHDCALEITDNQQTTHDLAKAILTVLNTGERAVNRLIAIRAICNDVILAHDNKDNG